MKFFTLTTLSMVIAAIYGQNNNETMEVDLELSVSMMIRNVAYQQPYRNLCVAMSKIEFDPMSEDHGFERLIWKNGEPASEALTSFAQGTSDCTQIKEAIEAERPNTTFPDIGELESSVLERNQWVNFTIPLSISEEDLEKEDGENSNSIYPFVTMNFVSNLANTNDGFVGVQNLPLRFALLPKIPLVSYMPLIGHDAGVELNTQFCKDMDAPACQGDSENANPQPGEGVVHVHRGFHTVQLTPEEEGEEFLDEATYDFRSPIGNVFVITSWSRVGDNDNTGDE